MRLAQSCFALPLDINILAHAIIKRPQNEVPAEIITHRGNAEKLP
jgi:hypothetical protein